MNDVSAGGLADWLTREHARLAKAWFGVQRYLANDVDAFVGDVVARLNRGELPDPSWVRAVKFRTTTDLRGGYRIRPVDELLDELRQRLLTTEGGRDLAPDVADAIRAVERVRFRLTRRAGYDPIEVDMFLDQVVEALTRGDRPGAAPAFTVRRGGYNRQDVDAFTDALRGDVGGG